MVACFLRFSSCTSLSYISMDSPFPPCYCPHSDQIWFCSGQFLPSMGPCPRQRPWWTSFKSAWEPTSPTQLLQPKCGSLHSPARATGKTLPILAAVLSLTQHTLQWILVGCFVDSCAQALQSPCCFLLSSCKDYVGACGICGCWQFLPVCLRSQAKGVHSSVHIQVQSKVKRSFQPRK